MTKTVSRILLLLSIGLVVQMLPWANESASAQVACRGLPQCMACCGSSGFSYVTVNECSAICAGNRGNSARLVDRCVNSGQCTACCFDSRLGTRQECLSICAGR